MLGLNISIKRNPVNLVILSTVSSTSTVQSCILKGGGGGFGLRLEFGD
jgi:hypothetical protein